MRRHFKFHRPSGPAPVIEPQQPAPKVTLDLDKLADIIIAKMKGNDAFRGRDGKDGEPGANGTNGTNGSDASVDLKPLLDKLASHEAEITKLKELIASLQTKKLTLTDSHMKEIIARLPPVVVRIRDGDDSFTQSKPLGVPIKIVVTGSLGASGTKIVPADKQEPAGK